MKHRLEYILHKDSVFWLASEPQPTNRHQLVKQSYLHTSHTDRILNQLYCPARHQENAGSSISPDDGGYISRISYSRLYSKILYPYYAAIVVVEELEVLVEVEVLEDVEVVVEVVDEVLVVELVEVVVEVVDEVEVELDVEVQVRVVSFSNANSAIFMRTR